MRPALSAEARQRTDGAAYHVRIVRALRGGAWQVSDLPTSFASVHSALEVAERLQQEFDEDAEPVRCYVLNEDRRPVRCDRGARR